MSNFVSWIIVLKIIKKRANNDKYNGNPQKQKIRGNIKFSKSEIKFSLDADAAKGTKPKSTKLRKLYYKISSKVHPDKGGSSEEFEAVNEAYEKSDYIELLKLAEKQGIDVNIDSEDKQLFEDSCNSLEQKINSKKGSLTWKYFNSDKVIKRVIIDQLVTEYQLKIPEKDIEKLLLV